MNRLIYADNAATTYLSQAALDEMLRASREFCGNPSSRHAVGRKAADYLESMRARIARCIGAFPDEIYFTSGGSEADNQAVATAERIGSLSGKKHIVVSDFEHHAVEKPIGLLESNGFEVTRLDVNSNGIIKPEQVEAAIRPDTCFVSVMFANNEIGTLQPIEEIGKICLKHNIMFHTDAVQAVGQVEIDLKKQNVSMLSASAHKFRGPRGVGFLYVRRGIKPVSLILGGSQEAGSRAGTENLPGIAGMATALEERVNSLEKNRGYVLELRERLAEKLLKIPGSHINGDRFARLPSNLNMRFDGIDGEAIVLQLDCVGVCASTGAACNSLDPEPDRVMLAMGQSEEQARGAVRLSLSEELTRDDIDFIAEQTGIIVDRIRNLI